MFVSAPWFATGIARRYRRDIIFMRKPFGSGENSMCPALRGEGFKNGHSNHRSW